MEDKNAGRPTVLTPEVVSILITSFQNGMTVREACWQSGISHEAYYNRARSDTGFADTMARAQAFCTIAARQTVINAIKGGDVATSKWWLEKKAPHEFGRDLKPEKVPESNPVENPFTDMSDEDFQKFGEELFYTLKKQNPDFNGELPVRVAGN